MLNYIWALMVLVGVVVGICNGRIKELGSGALDAAGSAVTLCITMLGIMSLWMGLMQIARASGLLERMTKGMRPVIRFLFPDLPKDSPAGEYIATNMIANILGLGWAATPAGLQAMQALDEVEEERRRKKQRCVAKGTASKEMCTFLIMNISSLQLIPINMIAYRSQYGSTNPAGIIVPAIVATMISTFAAVLFCKWKGRKGSI
ncbi:MAG: nucleoside recognition domain-containing protein [Lachnospiraceae bacterium]